MAERVVEQQLVSAAKIVEDQLDAEMEQLDRIDSSELENLRRKRLEEMKKHESLKKEWLAKGHGEYSELSDEKEFFNCCKKSGRVVCHFARDSTMRCGLLDKHLRPLAARHPEARFVRLSVEKAPFLVERLRVHVLPTIALVVETSVKDFVIGFDDLGGTDDFSTEMLEWRIARSGAIDYAGDLDIPPDSAPKRRPKTTQLQPKKNIRGRTASSDEDED